MARRINSTPKKDGFWMPGEFEEQESDFYDVAGKR